MLDAQLDKVESFYLAREKEMLARGHTLKVQLDELHDHRRLFLNKRPKETWGMVALASLRNFIGLYPPIKLPSKRELQQKAQAFPIDAKGKTSNNSEPSNINTGGTLNRASGAQATFQFLPSMQALGKRRDVEDSNGQSSDDDKSPDEHHNVYKIPLSADPDSYLYAKRKLKKAVIEHYRGLEVLHNYRILNITGFRKALKKFEKVTKIPVQHQYMTEKVEKSAFASDTSIRQMMTQMEDMYATSFVRGNKKKAMKRLRVGNNAKNHHFSSFRAGLVLGLALPAFVDGMVKAFQPETHEALPQWNVLLYIYGILLVPLLFSFLVGLNLLVWADSRINYVFIFGEANFELYLHHASSDPADIVRA
ncbi:hypothetical protein HYPSUDRAFT_362505 [Hypholoma sublateritium FD-334 SS-4]|uniref:SPX domain-containing protein n=1 Tax=Hypholoma sublateritium (strain FD-334 SS-4) TaxID=945553 RepID=A0A0D2NG09_HYPSF|nr:hypothetical protein HYPSUDRAFT_362505 [Hypholoma sublateritium FD-334 SS-4]